LEYHFDDQAPGVTISVYAYIIVLPIGFRSLIHVPREPGALPLNKKKKTFRHYVSRSIRTYLTNNKRIFTVMVKKEEKREQID